MEFLPAECAARSLGAFNGLFTLLMQTLVAAECAISPANNWPIDYGPNIITNGVGEYDFIIVGAGSAGSVLANRLSEIDNWKILLLEAGENPSVESEIPALFSRIFNTSHTWNHYGEKSDNFGKGLDHLFLPVGKMLGGSSGVNSMLYLRGHKRDYDQWQEMGNTGWGFDDLLKYFKKSEGFKLPQSKEGYHNHEGPLCVDSYNSSDPMKQVVWTAANELGYKEVKDWNTDEYLGWGIVQGTLHKGERCSTAKTFLKPIKHRQNLHIVKKAHVQKILLDDKMQAKGVKFLLNDTELEASATKEIILSAGVFGTPKILLLSGIGQSKDLEKLGIPVNKDLSVGDNLQDQPIVPYFIKLDATKSQPESLNSTVQQLFEYLQNRGGKFAGNGVGDLTGFVSTEESSIYPDIQYILVGFPKQMFGIKAGLAASGFSTEYIEQLFQANQEAYLLLVNVLLLNPKSRGKVTLNSKDPKEPPKIFPNYLEKPEDVETLIKGIKIFKKIHSTEAFKDHEAEAVRIKIEECDKIDFDSHDYWECYVRYFTKSVYQFVGTAKMGPNSDKNAVVDPNLKVKGIKGLRVIDASVIPKIPSGKMNAATIMIAEKGADLIKEDWKAR